jgi:hypothetical protein
MAMGNQFNGKAGQRKPRTPKALCALEHWKLEKWIGGGAMRSIALLLYMFFSLSIGGAGGLGGALRLGALGIGRLDQWAEENVTMQ